MIFTVLKPIQKALQVRELAVAGPRYWNHRLPDTASSDGVLSPLAAAFHSGVIFVQARVWPALAITK